MYMKVQEIALKTINIKIQYFTEIFVLAKIFKNWKKLDKIQSIQMQIIN